MRSARLFNRIPRTLILVENNVAFGSDGQSAVAFDVTTGAQKWTFLPGDDLTGVTLLNSRADGGATGYTADRNSGVAASLLTFDPSGTPASFPLAGSVNGSLTGSIDNLSLFDPATLLATTTTGQAQLAASIDLQPSESLWFIEAGDLDQRRPVLKLKCSSSVTRGSTGTCRVTGASEGTAFSNWKFTDSNGTIVTSGNTTSSWSGTMVASGTVSVKVGSILLTASITVTNRNWHTTPASPVEVPNGTFITLPVPPQPIGNNSGLGES